jgi:hypothetical protein
MVTGSVGDEGDEANNVFKVPQVPPPRSRSVTIGQLPSSDETIKVPAFLIAKITNLESKFTNLKFYFCTSLSVRIFYVTRDQCCGSGMFYPGSRIRIRGMKGPNAGLFVSDLPILYKPTPLSL